MDHLKGGLIMHLLIGAYLIIQSSGCNLTYVSGCRIVDQNDTLTYGAATDCRCLECEDSYSIDSTNICSPCSASIANCGTCLSSTTSTPSCTACDPTYILNNSTNQCDLCIVTCSSVAISNCTLIANGTCATCSSLFSNCLSCYIDSSTNPVCAACDSMYILNNSTNQCYFCNKSCSAIAITGCTLIDQNNTLGTCNPAFCGCLACNNSQGVYSNGGCSSCTSLILNCISCFSSTTSSPICTACNSMYVLNNSTNQCEFCNKTCTLTYLNGCATFDVNNTLNTCYSSSCGCLTCTSTFGILSNHTCAPCSSIIQNCNICTNTTTSPICQSCISNNYTLDSARTSCLFCNKSCTRTTLTGCTVVDVNNTLGLCNLTSCSCLACIVTFDMDATHNCKACNVSIPNCVYCKNTSTSQICTNCNNTYGLNYTSNQCYLCSSKFVGCNSCRQNTTYCIGCNVDNFFNSTSLQCQRCDTAMPYCIYCQVETYCFLCSSGCGFLPNRTCAPCIHNNANCTLCTYTSTCQTCVNATNIVMYNRSLCGQCSYAMPFCANCTSNVTCLSCNSSLYGINYTANPTQCLLCNITISNCLTCPNYTYCTACLNNSYALYYVDPNHQNCPTCLSLLNGCSTCSNRTVCLSCIKNGLYLYNPTDLSCVPCSFYLQFCATCLPTYYCLTCKDYRYAVSSSLVCQPCAYYINSCHYCDSNSTCTLCLQGRLLPDKSGCTTIVGCISIDKQSPPSSNCIACEPTMFLPDPFNGKCVCRKGWMVGSYCTTVIGCSRTSYNYVQVSCDACNIPQNFVWSNGICECAEHYVLKGQFCSQICGDGFVIDYECDDGNKIDGDGCSSKCEVQPRHHCDNDNTRFPSSKCQFLAQVRLTIQSILKTIEPNEVKLTFNMTPYSSKLEQMDLSNLVVLNASSCSITGIKISGKQLVVTFKFNDTIDNQPADLAIKFDYNYVKSPQYKLSFGMVESTGIQLSYTQQAQFSKTNTQMIKVLTWMSLSVFALGSLAFRMIGVETLYTIQIVRILQATSKYHTSFFANFQSLDYSYGQFGSFFGSAPTDTKFSNLGFKAGLIDNYFIIGLINTVAILVYGSVLAYRFRLKLGIQSDEMEERSLPPKMKKQNSIVQQRIEKVNRVLNHLYNWALFPIFMGFLMHFFHTIFVNEFNQEYKSTPLSYFSNIFFTFLATVFIFHYELLANNDGLDGILKNDGKNRYIAYFFIHNILVFLLSTLILMQSAYRLYYPIIGLVFFHMIYIVIRRPYSHALSNFAIFFNQLFVMFALFWLLVKNTSIDSRQNNALFILSFIVMGFFVNLLGTIRSIIFLKQKYWPASLNQLNQGNDLVANNDLKQNLKEVQNLDFTRLKITTQYDKIYTNMLDNPKIIQHPHNSENRRPRQKQQLSKSLKRKQFRKLRYTPNQQQEEN